MEEKEKQRKRERDRERKKERKKERVRDSGEPSYLTLQDKLLAPFDPEQDAPLVLNLRLLHRQYLLHGQQVLLWGRRGKRSETRPRRDPLAWGTQPSGHALNMGLSVGSLRVCGVVEHHLNRFTKRSEV